jgi:hypothetical protein
LTSSDAFHTIDLMLENVHVTSCQPRWREREGSSSTNNLSSGRVIVVEISESMSSIILVVDSRYFYMWPRLLGDGYVLPVPEGPWSHFSVVTISSLTQLAFGTDLLAVCCVFETSCASQGGFSCVACV